MGLNNSCVAHGRRFHDHWKNSVQQLIFLCSLIVWLETEKLATPAEIETLIGGMHLHYVAPHMHQCHAQEPPRTLASSWRTTSLASPVCPVSWFVCI